jgi:lysophospholipase
MDQSTYRPARLASFARNPEPSGAVCGFFDADDRVVIRFALWEATRGPHRGTVCLFPGRAECIEFYFEFVADLRRRGFAVAAMDLRGQGGSTRLAATPGAGHVADFRDYIRDVERFMAMIVTRHCPPPYAAFGHSLGGHVLLRISSNPMCGFSRMVLSAPMIALHDAKVGYPQPLVRGFVEIATALGFGRRMVPGGDNQPLAFAGNDLTSDEERFTRNRLVETMAPDLATGAPTIGWMRAAYRSIGVLADPRYPTSVAIPMLIFAAGRDRIVSTAAIEAFATRLKIGRHVLIPAAQHEIVQEKDEIRAQFWSAFDAYMGLSRAAA